MGLIVLSKYTSASVIFGPKMYEPSNLYGDIGVGTTNVTANVWGVVTTGSATVESDEIFFPRTYILLFALLK